ncbi:glycosyl transferase group 1 [Thermodesulfobacterium geofontis OPF15]|jgi:glycosyltransferase involved in cell wall biosynthesis|uniref:Glycosyl transferase group 1 n=1 Tax=Thermodesulfobacterium geofontis (strain OPF15) TaxID=795359 RepID=F8C3K7_THEGP|nr:glycosyltransferase [Thermodesulfobacterium geofontis]AEH22456.1 glycosyl transferase group 1 [Thermodesulfobacterium geofontis OPF15]
MKVLHLGKLCPPNEGGIEVFSFDLLEALNKKGIKVDLLCFGEDTREDNYNNFKYFACKMNLKLNSAPLSYDYIKTYRKIIEHYDIIHVHSPNPLAEILTLITDKKIIIHWHSDIVRQKISYFFYKPIQQKVLKKADKIIATSLQYLETSKQIKSYKNKAIVIPLGLNPKRLKINEQDLREFDGIKEKINNKKVVLAVGRLIEYKGFEYLVEASQFLKDDTVVLIAGGGPLYGTLKDKIEKLNLKDKVLLLGRVNNVSVYMKNCDLFCLPSISRNEAFGLVLVEALYFGKPLVTTNVEGSGMNYINKHNETGLIVPPKNPKALAEAINTILSDEKLYEKFSKNAFERFKEFEIDSVADRIIEVYEIVLKK